MTMIFNEMRQRQNFVRHQWVKRSRLLCIRALYTNQLTAVHLEALG